MFHDDLIKKMVLNVNSKLAIIMNTFHDLWYINHLCVKFWNIAILLGHLILLCTTKKLKKIQRRPTK